MEILNYVCEQTWICEPNHCVSDQGFGVKKYARVVAEPVQKVHVAI